MSEYEKIIIPLFVDYATPDIFTKEAGYIGMYTFDPESHKPKNLYFMFDVEKHNKYTEKIAKTFAGKVGIFNTIRVINNKHYVIYHIYVPKEKERFINGTFDLSNEDRLKIMSYWGLKDVIANKLLDDYMFIFDKEIELPFSDKVKSFDEIRTQGIYTTKGELSDDSQATPL